MDKISSLAFEECSVISFRSYDMFMLGTLRKWICIQHAVHSPLGRRRRRDAHPAAPDVSEKMQCESNNAMLSAATNAYCSSSDCLQKPRSIHSKIKIKSIPNQ